jgi:hypothetical protein
MEQNGSERYKVQAKCLIPHRINTAFSQTHQFEVQCSLLTGFEMNETEMIFIPERFTDCLNVEFTLSRLLNTAWSTYRNLTVYQYASVLGMFNTWLNQHYLTTLSQFHRSQSTDGYVNTKMSYKVGLERDVLLLQASGCTY